MVQHPNLIIVLTVKSTKYYIRGFNLIFSPAKRIITRKAEIEFPVFKNQKTKMERVCHNAGIRICFFRCSICGIKARRFPFRPALPGYPLRQYDGNIVQGFRTGCKWRVPW